jgi:hypothetical protein
MEIATEQLYALARILGEEPTVDQRLALGALAAQLEIANRLAGIEKSLDLGLSVRLDS